MTHATQTLAAQTLAAQTLAVQTLAAQTLAERLWTRAAAMLAAFVAAYLPAAAFARMKQAHEVLVRDALTRLRRVEALARRIVFAQALGLRVTPSLPRIVQARPRRALSEPVLDGDPSTWRVRFSVPLPGPRAPGRPRRAPSSRTPRHPLLLPPERLPQPHRPYDPAAAAMARQRARDRKEAAWRAYWYAPWPPPKEEGPAYIEIPPANAPEPMLSTLTLARRLEALRRVIADPAPYARRVAVRLARRPVRARTILSRWEARTRRVVEGDDTLRLARGQLAGARDDTS